MKAVNFVVNNFVSRNIVLFCIIIIPVFAQAIAYKDAQYEDLIYKGVALLFLYSVILLHNRILFEKVLLQRWYLPYLCGTVLAVYLMHKLLIALQAVIYRSMPEHSSVKWVSVFWADLVYIYAAFAVYLGYRHFRKKEEVYNIEILQRSVELKQLKEQLQPHFLFNALNNIYSYSLQGNEKASELILKLSEQMRYIMTQSAIEMAGIREELAFMDNYIEFEKERLGARCDIQFRKEIADDSRLLPPLLLFPFIENAFKHGANRLGDCRIVMFLRVASGEIFFSIKNTIFNELPVTSTYTGLSNARRRLELLYPGRHSLQVNVTEDQYHLQLTIHA